MIDVLDVNDHSPEFRDPVYRVDVAENVKMKVVHTVIATDKDSGENGNVSYSIRGNAFEFLAFCQFQTCFSTCM